MTLRTRRPVLSSAIDRAIVHLGLILVCTMLALFGLGYAALVSYLPAAALVEILSLVSPGAHGGSA